MKHSSQQYSYASSVAPNLNPTVLLTVLWRICLCKIILLSRGWAGKEEAENVHGQLFIYGPGICHGEKATWITDSHQTMRGLFWAARMHSSNKEGFRVEGKQDRKGQENFNTAGFKRKCQIAGKREEICQAHSAQSNTQLVLKLL